MQIISSVKLCDALTLLTLKLCTQYVDPVSTEGLMAQLDQLEWVKSSDE